MDPLEQRSISRFTVYSVDGLHAFNADRLQDGEIRLETQGTPILDKQQLKSLMLWLGMAEDD